MLKFLNYPINVVKRQGYEKISVAGLRQFRSFIYEVPGDISSASFL